MKAIIIVVLYNPTPNQQNRWRHVTETNCKYDFIFVDNTPGIEIRNQVVGNSKYISLGSNKGIAEAQNTGIEYAVSKGYEYCLFFDQDSEFHDLYIEQMIAEYNRIKSLHNNIAILGPLIINKDTQKNYKNRDLVLKDDFSVVTALISSGSISEPSIFKKVGVFEAALFIDYVDFEWCWRAQSIGLICTKTHNVHLNHKVGQFNKDIFGFPVIISSPFRYYYQYRNWMKLIKRKYVPLEWKIKVSIRKIIELIIIPMAVTGKKWETLKNMLSGIKDGII